MKLYTLRVTLTVPKAWTDAQLERASTEIDDCDLAQTVHGAVCELVRERLTDGRAVVVTTDND